MNPVYSINNKSADIPDIPLILEGLMDLAYTPSVHEQLQPGWNVGRQIVGLYLLELLLKKHLQDTNAGTGESHNLLGLYQKVGRVQRDKIERRYSELLRHVEWTWDVCKTVPSFLEYLGTDPITDTRYFWSRKRSDREDESILIMPDVIVLLIHAMMHVLHGYPNKKANGPYQTRFVSLYDSMDTGIII